MTTLDAAVVIAGPDGATLSDRAIRLAEGRIAGLAPAAAPLGGGSLVMPALVNAHDHARVVRSSQIGNFDVALEAWLPHLAAVPAVDPWLAAAVAFGRSARAGIAVEMAHYTRVQGLTGYLDEARAVAKAARDVGIRIAFAVQCRDRNPLVYGPHGDMLRRLSHAACACVSETLLRAPLPGAEQIALVEATAAAIAGDGVTVQYGPAGPQWCSDDLLARIGEASAAHGRRVHMHLLESRYQRAWADATYPHGLLNHLDGLGLVNARVSFAHGTWLRPDEMELIAERGATIVVNTSSNLVLRSGIAPLAEMLRRGCRVAMGLDGVALDEQEDPLAEMQLAYLLHKGEGFATTMSRDQLLRFALAAGRFAVLGEDAGGTVAPGAPADLLVLDWATLAADRLDDTVPPLETLLARARRRHVRDLFVAGRQVVRDGAVTGVDLPALETELLAVLKARFGSTAEIRAALPELRAALGAHYGAGTFICS
ncbi:amidohydrolase family protein [Rhodoplanes sp. TEM]|uniref:Amidohydrolase family protein n=1 Tax=Rhodoplanes tepidamans TaxID=200616 RepID=A0ABT5J375_RHOTP|nr:MULTISPECIES: amidohydrolase family protein [Rhodoplanes]MDC7784127.1 amidohydrolase family protein [Rhodoplanes tepidamans]MDC7983222.1 amidohydrolase family protein [Rhodoplanes sp. TEM]MDQ0356776.1 cytosine/adenosine deaminase-related metal-dependent hydrolase [Rhodoplanes tepidamans]